MGKTGCGKTRKIVETFEETAAPAGDGVQGRVKRVVQPGQGSELPRWQVAGKAVRRRAKRANELGAFHPRRANTPGQDGRLPWAVLACSGYVAGRFPTARKCLILE